MGNINFQTEKYKKLLALCRRVHYWFVSERRRQLAKSGFGTALENTNE